LANNKFKLNRSIQLSERNNFLQILGVVINSAGNLLWSRMYVQRIKLRIATFCIYTKRQ